MEAILSNLKRLPLKLLPEWLARMNASPSEFYSDFLKAPLKASSLPVLLQAQTSKEIKIQELKESLVLEVDSVRNIAVSQHRGGSDRLLAVNLTDGHSIIRAFEFEDLPDLPLDIKPGSKVLVIAPITVRRGVMILTAGKFMLLTEVIA